MPLETAKPISPHDALAFFGTAEEVAAHIVRTINQRCADARVSMPFATDGSPLQALRQYSPQDVFAFAYNANLSASSLLPFRNPSKKIPLDDPTLRCWADDQTLRHWALEALCGSTQSLLAKQLERLAQLQRKYHAELVQ